MLKKLFIALPVLFIAAFVLTMLTACETYSQTEPVKVDAHSENEPRPYNPNVDAALDLEVTLATAKANNKLAIIAMGANWCHDSRGFASQFEKERFQSELLREHFELLYIDVGEKNRNIDIAQNFGVEDIVGTPTVFVVDGDGNVLNLDTAPTWRNAASRSEDEIFNYFNDFAVQAASD